MAAQEAGDDAALAAVMQKLNARAAAAAGGAPEPEPEPEPRPEDAAATAAAVAKAAAVARAVEEAEAVAIVAATRAAEAEAAKLKASAAGSAKKEAAKHAKEEEKARKQEELAAAKAAKYAKEEAAKHAKEEEKARKKMVAKSPSKPSKAASKLSAEKQRAAAEAAALIAAASLPEPEPQPQPQPEPASEAEAEAEAEPVTQQPEDNDPISMDWKSVVREPTMFVLCNPDGTKKHERWFRCKPNSGRITWSPSEKGSGKTRTVKSVSLGFGEDVSESHSALGFTIVATEGDEIHVIASDSAQRRLWTSACQMMVKHVEAGDAEEAAQLPGSDEEVEEDEPAAVGVGHYKALVLCVIRKAAANDSEKVGELAKGEVVLAISTEDIDGTTRVQFDQGWLSVTAATDTALLEAVSYDTVDCNPPVAFKVLNSCTVRMGPERTDKKLGEYNRGTVLKMIQERTNSKGITSFRTNTPTKGVPAGGWVKLNDSKGKVLLEHMETRAPAAQPKPESEPEPQSQPEVKAAEASGGSLVRYKAVGVGVIRTGAAMNSDKAGKLIVGELIEVIATETVGDSQRVRFDRGWVSMFAKSGKAVLELVTGDVDDSSSGDSDSDSDSDSDAEVDSSVAAAAVEAEKWRVVRGAGFVYTEMPLEELARRRGWVLDVPLFSGLDVSLAEKVARIFEPRLVERKTVVIEKGVVGEQEMYFVAHGEVEVLTDLDTPAFATLTAGKFFGESSLLESTPRNACVRARKTVLLYVLRKTDLKPILRESPEAEGQMADALRMHMADRAEQREAMEELFEGGLLWKTLLEDSDDEKSPDEDEASKEAAEDEEDAALATEETAIAAEEAAFAAEEAAPAKADEDAAAAAAKAAEDAKAVEAAAAAAAKEVAAAAEQVAAAIAASAAKHKEMAAAKAAKDAAKQAKEDEKKHKQEFKARKEEEKRLKKMVTRSPRKGGGGASSPRKMAAEEEERVAAAAAAAATLMAAGSPEKEALELGPAPAPEPDPPVLPEAQLDASPKRGRPRKITGMPGFTEPRTSTVPAAAEPQPQPEPRPEAEQQKQSVSEESPVKQSVALLKAASAEDKLIKAGDQSRVPEALRLYAETLRCLERALASDSVSAKIKETFFKKEKGVKKRIKLLTEVQQALETARVAAENAEQAHTAAEEVASKISPRSRVAAEEQVGKDESIGKTKEQATPKGLDEPPVKAALGLPPSSPAPQPTAAASAVPDMKQDAAAFFATLNAGAGPKKKTKKKRPVAPKVATPPEGSPAQQLEQLAQPVQPAPASKPKPAHEPPTASLQRGISSPLMLAKPVHKPKSEEEEEEGFKVVMDWTPRTIEESTRLQSEVPAPKPAVTSAGVGAPLQHLILTSGLVCETDAPMNHPTSAPKTPELALTPRRKAVPSMILQRGSLSEQGVQGDDAPKPSGDSAKLSAPQKPVKLDLMATATVKMPRSQFVVGQQIELMSASLGGWQQATVTAVTRELSRVEYAGAYTVDHIT